MSTRPAVMPEVTDAHRRAAFEAMHWEGWTYEAAMADDTHRRVVEARAHQIRTREACGRALMPTPSLPVARPAAPLPPVQAPALFRPPLAGAIDRKRAAAGDRDDD
ncbi:MAG: hypothetical protein ACT6UH_00550 [Hydrogenophaga sp.]|uniref:hypothetical protein n=1 Tax=Hydrogenophaga sp. TaxID=1904254 RepID=UPI00403718EE